jgi:hypothetical protein
MSNSGISSCRDRTSEFHSTIRTFQSRMVFFSWFDMLIFNEMNGLTWFFSSNNSKKNNTNPVAVQNGSTNRAKQNLENRSKFMLIARWELIERKKFYLKNISNKITYVLYLEK